jgi:hypothetical protein
MTPATWLQMALGVLPDLPHAVTGLLGGGGQVTLDLQGTTDEHLQARIGIGEVAKGAQLTIPVETADRGGYSIVCAAGETFFLGGLDTLIELEVLQVARRKPYRLKPRIAVHDTAVVVRLNRGSAESFVVRLMDISSSGIGFTTDARLAIGDRLRVEASVRDIRVLAEGTVVQLAGASFGRLRVGCQFAGLAHEVAQAIDAAAAAQERHEPDARTSPASAARQDALRSLSA